jgi:hypothetical protein
MASDIISTTQYANTDTDLVGGTYVLGDSLYVRKADLRLSNKAADGVTQIGTAAGIIGLVQEAPSLSSTGSRMVLRLVNSDATLRARLKVLLQATEV